MRRLFWVAGALALLVSFAAQSAVVRVSGDNEWQVFHNGEMIAQSNNWQVPTVDRIPAGQQRTRADRSLCA